MKKLVKRIIRLERPELFEQEFVYEYEEVPDEPNSTDTTKTCLTDGKDID